MSTQASIIPSIQGAKFGQTKVLYPGQLFLKTCYSKLFRNIPTIFYYFFARLLSQYRHL